MAWRNPDGGFSFDLYELLQILKCISDAIPRMDAGGSEVDLQDHLDLRLKVAPARRVRGERYARGTISLALYCELKRRNVTSITLNYYVTSADD